MISTKTKPKPKTKNIVLLALISTIFILSIVSYAIPSLQSQQAFGQGAFQTEDDDQSPPQLTIGAANNETDQTEATTTTDNNQRIILDDITIPITSNTHLSLELPDSTITVEPNK
jgi:flagellar basal body-associated protein FliL